MTVIPIFCAWASSHTKTRQDHENKGQSWKTAVLTRPVLYLWWEQSVCSDLQLGWGSGIQPSGRLGPGSSARCLGCVLMSGGGNMPRSSLLCENSCAPQTSIGAELYLESGQPRSPGDWPLAGIVGRFLEAVGLMLIMSFGVKNLRVFSVFYFFIEEQSSYSVELISAIEWSDLFIHRYIFFFIFFSIMVYWI